MLVVLPEAPSPLVTRELLYTAATRARRELIVAGPEEVLRRGLATRIHRTSGLAAKLGGAS